MARQLRIEYPNAFYHITQRGIERKNIFISDRDKEKFLFYIESAHKAYAAVIHTYALMNNHYHLALETPRANLSKIMHYIDTSYAIYFNTKRKRVGPLYQGRYKAILVQEDEYFHYLSRYIHLNPVRAKIVEDPIEYRWSSYAYFVSKDKPPAWLNTNFILSMFDLNMPTAKMLYKDFVLNGIGHEKDIIEKNTLKGFLLGNKDFFEHIKKCFLKSKKETRDFTIPKSLKQNTTITAEYIEKLVEEKAADNKKLKRKISIYLMRKFTEVSLCDIANFYKNIKYKSVSKICGRMEISRRHDKALDGLLHRIEESIRP